MKAREGVGFLVLFLHSICIGSLIGSARTYDLSQVCSWLPAYSQAMPPPSEQSLPYTQIGTLDRNLKTQKCSLVGSQCLMLLHSSEQRFYNPCLQIKFRWSLKNCCFVQLGNCSFFGCRKVGSHAGTLPSSPFVSHTLLKKQKTKNKQTKNKQKHQIHHHPKGVVVLFCFVLNLSALLLSGYTASSEPDLD